MAYANEHRKEKQRASQQRYRERIGKEAVNEARRAYYAQHQEEEKLRRREYHQLNTEKEASAQAAWYRRQKIADPNFMQHKRDLRNAYTRKLRAEVLQHYGGKCACCGETEPKFLALDHIAGDGKQHRKVRGSEFYRQVRNERFPVSLQLLCHNCNLAKGFYGICPHQKVKEN